MRCDLHVHTVGSGMCSVPVASSFCRECYSQPAEVYGKLKRLEMNLVTITDHDSIEASEELRRFDDFFLSEEATCVMPSGTQVHIGIYGITERQHIEIQRRRGDLFSLIAYLNENRLFFSVNHLLSRLTGRRELSDYEWFERLFPCFETMNGSMVRNSNRFAAQLAALMGKTPIGGSDAHTLASVGSAYTRVPGARTKEEFLAGLRHGQTVVAGESGSYWKLTRDVLLICAGMARETKWTVLASPAFAGVPAVLLVNYWLEHTFAKRWFGRIMTSRPHWDGMPLGPAFIQGVAPLSAREVSA